MKKEAKQCAYDLFLCGVAGTEIVLACSLAKYINVMDINHECCEAIGCAVGASVSGAVLLVYGIDRLCKHLPELMKKSGRGGRV